MFSFIKNMKCNLREIRLFPAHLSNLFTAKELHLILKCFSRNMLNQTCKCDIKLNQVLAVIQSWKFDWIYCEIFLVSLKNGAQAKSLKWFCVAKE